MKKIFVFAVITAAMSLVSCGATKQAAPQYGPQVPQSPQSSYQNPVNPQPPTVVKAQELNSVELWMMQSGGIRAYGMRDAKTPIMAMQYARNYALGQLATAVAAKVQAAMKSYNSMVQAEGEVISEELRDEGVITTIASEFTQNTPNAIMYKETLSNGNTRYWVGVEFIPGDNTAQLVERYTAYIQAKTNEIKINAQKFHKAMESEFDKYEAEQKDRQQ